jgi:predicted RNA methylase
MDAEEYKLIDEVVGPSTVMLEWGSGHSTVRYASRVNRLCSVEHNPKWYEKVKAEVSKSDDYRLVPAPNRNYTAYVEAVKFFGTKFSVVLVDGHARLQCLLEVIPWLADQHVVFLHDYNGLYYKPALKEFRLIDKVGWLAVLDLKRRGKG